MYATGDARQPLVAGVEGLNVDLSTVPEDTLVAVEGYFAGDAANPAHYAHTVEASSGTLVDPEAVSITRVRCEDGGRLEIRGGNFEAGTITVFDDGTGEQLGTVAAVDDPESGVAAYVFRQDVAVCPTTVRVENAQGSTATADTATGAPPVDEEPPEPPEDGDAPQTLTIAGAGSRASYTFTVGGEIVSATGISSEDFFEVGGDAAQGAVRNGSDVYEVTGGLLDFQLNGDATVDIEGVPVETSNPLQNTLTIQGSRERANYEFTASGPVEAASTLTREDSINGNSVVGAVRDGSDSYFYEGDITDFTIDAAATIVRNGTIVTDPTA